MTHSSRQSYKKWAIALGKEFDALPPVLRQIHRAEGCTVEGYLRVRWSRFSWLRALLYFSPLPHPAESAPCRADIIPDEKGELWQRRIGNSRFSSRMGLNLKNQKRDENLIVERMGPWAFHLETQVRHHFDSETKNAVPGKCLVMHSRQVTLLGLPFPWLAVVAHEYALDNEHYRCDIRIWIPRWGYLLRYDGMLSSAPNHPPTGHS